MLSSTGHPRIGTRSCRASTGLSTITDKMSTLSREAAELLVRKRELLDMHVMLRKLGR